MSFYCCGLGIVAGSQSTVQVEFHQAFKGFSPGCYRRHYTAETQVTLSPIEELPMDAPVHIWGGRQKQGSAVS